MYTTVPLNSILKLAFLLIISLMTLYTFLCCMGIRPSTSDISSLFIYFIYFDFYNYGFTGIIGEILELKKGFYLFFVSVLSIPSNAFFMPREAFVVLEFVFATPVCYVSNFLLSPLDTNRTRANAHK